MLVSKSLRSIFISIFRRLINYLNLLLIRPEWINKNIYIGPAAEINGANYMNISQNFYVRYGLWMDAISRYRGQEFSPCLQIGRGFSASRFLHIACINKITIGDDCLFGSNVMVTDHSHGNMREPFPLPSVGPIAEPLHSSGEVFIGDRVWLGDNVVILPGAKIEDDVIVGANSVVSGYLPTGHICAGVPCRALRPR
jgi:acetyltransferase-like isoleucine patch superfamily enzyme